MLQARDRESISAEAADGTSRIARGEDFSPLQFRAYRAAGSREIKMDSGICWNDELGVPSTSSPQHTLMTTLILYGIFVVQQRDPDGFRRALE